MGVTSTVARYLTTQYLHPSYPEPLPAHDCLECAQAVLDAAVVLKQYTPHAAARWLERYDARP